MRTGRGSTDRFGRSGDVDYRYPMIDEDVMWKIADVRDIMAGGPLPRKLRRVRA